MNFQDLIIISKSEEIVENAANAMTKRGNEIRSSSKYRRMHDRLKKSKFIEIEKIKVFEKKIIVPLQKIIVNYPSLDSLPEFYQQLIKITLSLDKMKKSLGSVKWSVEQINKLTKKITIKIKSAKELKDINYQRKSYMGRTASILKQIKKDLLYLEECRKTMKRYPSIKTGIMTVAISGFPNVGKSTLLKKITGANPEIQNYAFTTKRLNLGYKHFERKKVQFVDTPGTLSRNKMNDVEKQADLALKYVADVIIYVFDLTDTYPLSKQLQLYKMMKEYDKEIKCYISKTDITDETKIKDFLKENKDLKIISSFSSLQTFLKETSLKYDQGFL